MAGDAPGSTPVRGRTRGMVPALLRVVAWGALLGATGWLVRAEVERRRLPEGVWAITDLVYRHEGDRRARLDIYMPREAPPPGGRPAVLAIHGGGWRGGDKESYGGMAAVLAQRGYVVVAVDYRLSKPGAPSWPGNVEDLRAAVRWLRRHASAYGVDPDRIAALGASAGGHLAALLGSLPEDPGALPGTNGHPASQAPDSSFPDRAVSSRVQAVIDFYGPADLAPLANERPRAGTSVALFLGGAPGEVPDRYATASPVRHVTPDDPPMLLIHGAEDRLVPLDQSQRLADALAVAGVSHRLIVVAGARHGFDFQVGPRDLLPEILAFLESAWNVNSETSAR